MLGLWGMCMTSKSRAAELLRAEIDTFESQREELLGRYKGKWVLVKGQEVDVYETRSDALANGYEKYKLSPFLVRKVVAHDTRRNFVSNHIAI